jgi:alpha,alpha-trehalose phosphorylase
MLPQARARAKELGHRGAMFPWRTINGEEASAYYPAGTAQYHINADIMYALRKYVQATGDELFLRDYGAEMLVETARLWVDLGFYSGTKGGRFCINGVTGPDEDYPGNPGTFKTHRVTAIRYCYFTIRSTYIGSR